MSDKKIITVELDYECMYCKPSYKFSKVLKQDKTTGLLVSYQKVMCPQCGNFLPTRSFK